MHTCIPTYIHTYIHTDIQTYRHTDTQTYRHTDIQTYRHTDIQTSYRERERCDGSQLVETALDVGGQEQVTHLHDKHMCTVSHRCTHRCTWLLVCLNACCRFTCVCCLLLRLRKTAFAYAPIGMCTCWDTLIVGTRPVPVLRRRFCVGS